MSSQPGKETLDTAGSWGRAVSKTPRHGTHHNAHGSLPITERLCSEVLSLPIFPELSAEQQSRVIEVLQQITAKAPESVAA